MIKTYAPGTPGGDIEEYWSCMWKAAYAVYLLS